MPRPAAEPYRKSRILITGGTGSIGTELLGAVLARGSKDALVLSNDENGLFEMSNAYENDPRVEFRFGDVRDTRSLNDAVSGCDIVFHAAALKHVAFCEINPYEAITTNIIGTQNLIDKCIEHSVSKLVLISTDKAVNPVNTMGATKLLAEKLVLSASKRSSRTVFSIVRFGNVIGSRGSVVLVFERQVRAGGPITVTNPSMTRFIMSPSDASDLILHAAEQSLPGEIFVLKMKAVRIRDLAEACRTFFAEMFAKEPSEIKVKIVGAQPGEKMHEELMNGPEAKMCLDTGQFYIINPNERRRGTGLREKTANNPLSSNSVNPLSNRQIVSELKSLYGKG